MEIYMQISKQSKEIIDSCRFCWMCHHICPIGNATGHERNTARARALSLSLVERGAAELGGDVIDNVYECGLCGACTKECVTGWDPVKSTKETRLYAALNGQTPEYINAMIDNIESTGNVYGKTEISDGLKKAVSELPKTADTLLFLGRDAVYANPDAAADAIALLKKAGVEFTVMADEPDSGYALDVLVGAADETKKIMEKCAKAVEGFKTVVCYDPADAKVFLREYKEWGIKTAPSVVTFTAFVDGLIADGSLKPKKSDDTYFFQDPALLARDLEETEPARRILGACGNVGEMLMHGRDTMWAGNLIMNEYMPKVMNQVAAKRIGNLLTAGGKIIVTASPSENVLLKAAASDGVTVMSIEEVVLRCL